MLLYCTLKTWVEAISKYVLAVLQHMAISLPPPLSLSLVYLSHSLTGTHARAHVHTQTHTQFCTQTGKHSGTKDCSPSPSISFTQQQQHLISQREFGLLSIISYTCKKKAYQGRIISI